MPDTEVVAPEMAVMPEKESNDDEGAREPEAADDETPEEPESVSDD